MTQRASSEPQETVASRQGEPREPTVHLDYLDYPYLHKFFASSLASRFFDRPVSHVKRELQGQIVSARSRKRVEVAQVLAEIDRVMRRFGDKHLREFVPRPAKPSVSVSKNYSSITPLR